MARLGAFVTPAIMMLAALPDPAQAGSRSWMSDLVLRDPPPVRRIALDARGHAEDAGRQAVTNDDDMAVVDANLTSHDAALGRRYLVASGMFDGVRGPWPNGAIFYCYETPETEAELDADFVKAVDLWLAALGSRFTMQRLEGVASGPACTGHTDRKHILVVHHTPGSLSSSVGYSPNRKPAYIKLTTSTAVGALNVLTNMAHEIGHVWGLHHEHQDPYYWSGTPHSLWPGDNPATAPFQMGHFFCQSLSDYEEKEAEAIARGVSVQDMCRDITVASDMDFSAKDWLPHEKDEISSEVEPGDDETWDEVDWDSIMLYPSQGGGLGNAGPPELGEPDNRAFVLQAWKAEEEAFGHFGFNMVPSDRDIKGLKRMVYDDLKDELEEYEQILPLENDSEDHRAFIDQVWVAVCAGKLAEEDDDDE